MAASETATSAVPASSWMPRRLLSDARLARLAGRGDQRAFGAIFERYHQELYRYCRAILRDSHEAQDALQSTMASALSSLPGDEREIALRPWLYRVAHNEAISILRRRAGVVHADRVPDSAAPGADSEAEARERLRHLVADLDELPERQRGALVMRELSGLSYAEIGTALAASEGAARQTVYEARVALRELELGREMECEAAQHALSERDGRILRSRRLRAHLRVCEACEGFRAAIRGRRAELGALYPPLPAAAAAGLLSTILGGTGKGGIGAATGTVAGGTGAGMVGGTAVTGPVAAKGVSLAVAVVVGAGAAGMSGVVKLPVVDRAPSPSAVPASAPGTGDPAVSSASHRAMAGGAAGATAAERARRRASSQSTGRAARSSEASNGSAGRGNGAGASSSPDAASSGDTGGTLPATANGTPPEHSSAGGNSHADAHSGASGGTSSRKPGSPPGLSNAGSNAPTLPAHAQGNPGSPPEKSASPPAHSHLPPVRASDTALDTSTAK